MFPFVVVGETRVPGVVEDGMDAAAAAPILANWLRRQGARDVTVQGTRVAFTLPWMTLPRISTPLEPVDGGVIELREEGTTLVLAYRVRLRRAVAWATFWLAIPATFGLAVMNYYGLITAIVGAMGLVGIARSRRTVARALQKVVAQEAKRLTAARAAAALAPGDPAATGAALPVSSDHP